MFDFTDLKSVNDTSIVVRLLLAMVLGGMIGFERGRSGRPAGLRTHILVSIGATMAMMTNQYIFQEFGASDPTRIAAQVISGIGFLGAGTILVTGRHQVKGLTTAAGLWATACMGIAIGIGFYSAAILTGILIFFSTVVLHRFDNLMLSKSKVLDMYVEFESGEIIQKVLEQMKQSHVRIDEIEMVKPAYDNTSGRRAAIMTLRLNKRKMRLEIVSAISSIEGVMYAEEI